MLMRRVVSLPVALILCLALPASEPGKVGSYGDLTTLELSGATSIPETAIRNALDRDLGLLLASQPDAALADWLAILSDDVGEAYHADGFLDAKATATTKDGHVLLAITEGEHLVCGEIAVTAEAAVAGQIRRRLLERPPRNIDSEIDIESGNGIPAPAWKPGKAVNWSRKARKSLAQTISTAIRDAGLVGATSTIDLQAGKGTALLVIAVTRPPVAMTRGNIVVEGLPDDQAERLRRWLDIPPDVLANDDLSRDVARRLRASGCYREMAVGWEDQGNTLPATFMLSQPMDLTDAVRQQDAEAALARIIRKGRADLHLKLRPVADVPPPWEAPSREMARVLAAHDRLVARLGSGKTSVVVDSASADSRNRLIWSPLHGLAFIRKRDDGRTTRLALSDTLVCQASGQESIRIAIPSLETRMSLTWAPRETDLHRQLSIAGEVSINSRPGGPSVQLGLNPAAMVWGMLRSDIVSTAWDGDVLSIIKRKESGSLLTFRIDPAGDIRVEVPDAGVSPIVISLSDDAWDGEASPLINAPTGTSSAAGFAAVVEEAFLGLSRDPKCDLWVDGLAMALRLGLYDFIATKIPGPSDFNIPADPNPSRHRPIPNSIATYSVWIDAAISRRLRQSAWPRCLLRSTALLFCGEQKAASRGLQPIFADPDAGPFAFLTCAAGAKALGFQPLAEAFADQGLARCNADGLAADARTLAALAPELLPALSRVIDSVATTETDAGRAASLKELSVLCREQPGRPAAAFEAVARQSTILGLDVWLRKQLESVRIVGESLPRM